MGLFDLFKKPTTIQDPFFGPLRWVTNKDASKNCYEGNRMFGPINETVEFFIQCDLSGPTSAQREFYQHLQTNYDVLIEKAIPLIEKEFRNDIEGFKILNFRKEFIITLLNIPRLEKTPFFWDASFESIGDKNYFFTIDFKDFDPIQVYVE